MALVNRNIVTAQRHIIPTSLTHSAGTITAVVNGTSYAVNLSGLTANTLYFLYLRINSGTAQLFFVTTVPSTYRVSFPEALLVGAFYANQAGSPGFGAFVSIEGRPVSGEVSIGALAHLGSSSNPTKPSASTDYAYWYREGSELRYFYSWQAAGAGSGGTGEWRWPLPTNLVVDFTRKNGSGSANTNGDHYGQGRWGNASAAYSGGVAFPSNSQLHLQTWPEPSASILTFSGGSSAVSTASATYGGFECLVPIVGWTNTPLKDL